MDLKSFASAQQYFSRRNFMRSAGIASAAVASMPAFAMQAAAPQAGRAGISTGPDGSTAGRGAGRQPMSPDTVIISSNENPLGPAPCALEAIGTAAKKGGRYDREYSTAMTKAISDQMQLKPSYVRIYRVRVDRSISLCTPTSDRTSRSSLAIPPTSRVTAPPRQ